MSQKSEYLISAISLKQSHNKLLPTSQHPALLSLSSGGLVEMSIDRFAMLTKQPKRADSVVLYNYTKIESDPKKRGLYYAPPTPQKTVYPPRSQPVSFTWTSERMPLIKVRRATEAKRELLTWKESLYMNPVREAPVKPAPTRCLRFK